MQFLSLVFLIAVIIFIFSVKSPAKLQSIFRGKFTNKQLKVGSICIALILFIVIGALNSPQETKPETLPKQEIASTDNKSPIPYEVLESRNSANRVNEYHLEILISPQDATKENIIALIKFLIPQSSKRATVNFYQDKQAWVNAENNKYGETFDKGFIANYIKNMVTDSDFKGYNAIKWMQVKGQLQSLEGTETKIE